MAISILACCTLIALLVFGVMVYSIATFRTESGGTRANFRPRALIEVLWVLIPIAIFISAALPAARMIGTAEIKVAEAERQSGASEMHRSPLVR